jgi:hypothetical protein
MFAKSAHEVTGLTAGSVAASVALDPANMRLRIKRIGRDNAHMAFPLLLIEQPP